VRDSLPSGLSDAAAKAAAGRQNACFAACTIDRPSRRRGQRPAGGRARIVLAIALLAFVIAGAWIVRAARHGSSGPRVTEVAGLYADARLVNFESAEPGTKVAGAFHLVNRGASNIDILGVTTSCGCVVAHVPPQTLSPSAGLSIPFTIALPGDAIDPQVSRQVIVRVKSAGVEQTVSLRVAATLKTTTPLVAIPGRADFGIVSAGAPATKHIHIRGPRAALALLPAQVALRPDLQANITRALNSDESAIGYNDLQLTMDVPALPPGTLITSTLNIEFTGKTPMRLTLPVRAKIGAGRPVAEGSAANGSALAEPKASAIVAKENR